MEEFLVLVTGASSVPGGRSILVNPERQSFHSIPPKNDCCLAHHRPAPSGRLPGGPSGRGAPPGCKKAGARFLHPPGGGDPSGPAGVAVRHPCHYRHHLFGRCDDRAPGRDPGCVGGAKGKTAPGQATEEASSCFVQDRCRKSCYSCGPGGSGAGPIPGPLRHPGQAAGPQGGAAGPSPSWPPAALPGSPHW